MKAVQEETRSRLGRGLAALIGDSGEEGAALVRARGQKRVPIEFLRANPRNPRTIFDEADLEELTASIREKGIIQPILVRTVPGTADAYEIIAGERRWRAAQRAGLHDVPIVTIEADDKQALEIAIIENVQRSDLNALEEALGYERLGAEFGYSQGDLARVIGKSRPHVANTMRLLKLPDRARGLLSTGRLSAGHARALLASRRPRRPRRARSWPKACPCGTSSGSCNARTSRAPGGPRRAGDKGRRHPRRGETLERPARLRRGDSSQRRRRRGADSLYHPRPARPRRDAARRLARHAFLTRAV